MKITRLRAVLLSLPLMALGCGHRTTEVAAKEKGSVELPRGVILEITGAIAGDSLGRAVENVGDVNGDGVPDIAVGAPGSHNLAGELRIHSGADGKVIHRFAGDASGIVLGRAIARLGDVDGDRRDDFLVAAPQSDLLSLGRDLPDAGTVQVYSGASGRVLQRYDGKSAGEYVGKGVAGTPDLDGDQIPDFLFSSPGEDSFRGAVQLHSGKTGLPIRTYRGEEPGGRYGWAVAAGADLDGDGKSEIGIGAPWSSLNGKVNSGTVYLYSGASQKLLYKLHGTEAGDGFGNSVALLPDVNGDGFGELAVGAPLANPKSLQDGGIVYLFSGKDGALLFQYGGSQATSLLGFSVDQAGDVDGDGKCDLLAGSQWADANGLYNPGSAVVISGATGKPLLEISGVENGQELGFAVAWAGDLDQDHHADLLLGSPGAHGFAGSAWVVSTAKYLGRDQQASKN